MKQYLLTAGPTPVRERVLLAMARPVLYHRARAFNDYLKENQEGLKWLFQTKQTVLQLTGSGTLAMEAAVCNFLRHGDRDPRAERHRRLRGRAPDARALRHRGWR